MKFQLNDRLRMEINSKNNEVLVSDVETDFLIARITEGDNGREGLVKVWTPGNAVVCFLSNFEDVLRYLHSYFIGRGE